MRDQVLSAERADIAPLYVFFGCIVLTGFSYLVLRPTIGWDDANITLNYAENVARGHGYVYYVGGERVEGSTSALWTFICALGYLVTPTPENLLTVVSFLFAFGTVLFTWRTARTLFRLAGLNPDHAVLPVLGFFAAVPNFFGVTVFSLMETSLVCFAASGFVWAAIRHMADQFERAPREGSHVLELAVFAVLLALARPEGIALVLGGCMALAIVATAHPRLQTRKAALVAGAAAALALAVLTLARLAYFGVPFPNTYYAKVATDTRSELLQGFLYLKSYLKEPEYIALILLSVVALALAFRRRYARPGLLPAIAFLAAIFAGTLALYTVMGGDIFPGHRYYLVALAALVPAASLAVVSLVAGRGARVTGGVAAAFAAAAAFQSYDYAASNRNFGHMDVAFHNRLSESARETGRRLAMLPEGTSIAVYIAGGVAMTFDGPIYDMNGLNWVEMAHTNRHDRDGYGGFTKDVLLKARPDIVSPQVNDCADTTWTSNVFVTNMLHGLFEDPEFLDLYVADCWQGMTFFRRQDYSLP